MISMDNIGLILTKLGNAEFDGWTVDDARITKDRFCAIMMMPGVPHYDSIRTAIEKWKTIQVLGFARGLNKTAVKFNIPYVKAHLNSQKEE